MKQKANFDKIQQRLKISSGKRKRLIIVGALGILVLYFGPKLGFLFATWSSDNVVAQELPNSENKIDLDSVREKILSIVLFKDEILIHKGKEMELGALNKVENISSLKDILIERSQETNTKQIHLVKFDSTTNYDHVVQVLDIVVELYEEPLYAIERFSMNENEKLGLHIKNR